MTEKVRGLRLAEIEDRLDGLSLTLASDGVRLAYLFGSVLEQPLARDVDLAILFERAVPEDLIDFDEFARQVRAYPRT